ncbi:MAG: TRAP transporter substrate-binding protein [Alphaproteobacteria bacterium]|nr:TRAP transporter substrate-binding protein [Alphaproteobacteria bacterium]
MSGLIRRTGLKIAAATAALAIAAPAFAQETWKVGSAAQPGSALMTILEGNIANFNKVAGFKSERQFVASEQELAQQVLRGRLQMASISFAGLSPAGLQELALVNVPFLWASEAERDFVLDGTVWKYVERLLDAKGLVGLGMGEVGWNGVICKQACPSPEALKGLKARVAPTPASRMFWQALGANGVQMPLSELFPGLQQNLVVAADLPFPYYVTTPARESTPFYYTVNHLHHPSMVVVNKAAWGKLTADQQKALRAAMIPIADQRKAVADEIAQKVKEFRAGGGTYVELTQAQRDGYRKLVEPRQMELVQAMPGKSVELFDLMQAGRREFQQTRGTRQ